MVAERRLPIGKLIWGLAALIIGFAHEALSNPIQPITYVPGLAFFPLGLGIGVALVEWKFPKYRLLARMPAAMLVCYYTITAATSLLPLCLYIAGDSLTRFAFFFLEE